MNEYERFKGFSDIYDKSRPTLPREAIEILKKYKDTNIETIVDIGCGTGLSTKICTEFSKNVIGIEPSTDMLNEAKKKENDNLKFKQGFGENTGLPKSIADIVICSQAFHWMNPEMTLNEVYRILKPNGIFAVINADYPPIINKELEKLYLHIINKAKTIENFSENIIVNKAKYIDSIKNCNLYDYCREICFSKAEKYDKDRFMSFILSHSTVQQFIKNNNNVLKDDLETLDDDLEEIFKNKTLEAIFSYRMSIGIK